MNSCKLQSHVRLTRQRPYLAAHHLQFYKNVNLSPESLKSCQVKSTLCSILTRRYVYFREKEKNPPWCKGVVVNGGTRETAGFWMWLIRWFSRRRAPPWAQPVPSWGFTGVHSLNPGKRCGEVWASWKLRKSDSILLRHCKPQHTVLTDTGTRN